MNVYVMKKKTLFMSILIESLIMLKNCLQIPKAVEDIEEDTLITDSTDMVITHGVKIIQYSEMKAMKMINSGKNSLSRQKLGCQTGIISLAFNLLLFTGKFTIGFLSNSISVIADSFNNLTDCVSSMVTILGFWISSKAKDQSHPYGYGRMEYISGFVVSILIMVTAFSLGRISILRILSPQPIIVSNMLIIIPIIGVSMKLLLAFIINRANKVLSSATLKASFKDNIADSMVTSITLLSIVIINFTSFPLDGFIGLLVTVPLLWSGLTSFLDNINLLLGKSLNKDLENDIREMILSYEVFREIQSMTVHDYGPENRISIIQVVLNQCPNTFSVKHVIDDVTAKLKENYNLNSTIYWTSDCQFQKEECSNYVRTA